MCVQWRTYCRAAAHASAQDARFFRVCILCNGIGHRLQNPARSPVVLSCVHIHSLSHVRSPQRRHLLGLWSVSTMNLMNASHQLTIPENCNPPSNSCGLGYDIVNNISRMARLFGSVTTFRAYLDIATQSSKSAVFRSELQSSGVSMIDCPHNGKKDVVDKMIIGVYATCYSFPRC